MKCCCNIVEPFLEQKKKKKETTFSRYCWRTHSAKSWTNRAALQCITQLNEVLMQSCKIYSLIYKYTQNQTNQMQAKHGPDEPDAPNMLKQCNYGNSSLEGTFVVCGPVHIVSDICSYCAVTCESEIVTPYFIYMTRV